MKFEGKWSDKEIQQLADKLAEQFRDIDPHLLYKALPIMFEHFCNEGMAAEKKGDKQRNDYFACLALMIAQLGAAFLDIKVVVPDIQDKSNIYNAIRKGKGGLN